MSNELFQIRNILNTLSKNNNSHAEVKLVQELIDYAESYKARLIKLSENDSPKVSMNQVPEIKMERISEETFLYKAVTVKNYYEGDYLENFSNIRTSDLKTSGVLDIHNKFWQAHEVNGGNIFATIPLDLVDSQQATKLQSLNWCKIKVDIYEIDSEVVKKLPKYKINEAVGKLFSHYILIREVYGNIFMVLHYKS